MTEEAPQIRGYWYRCPFCHLTAFIPTMDRVSALCQEHRWPQEMACLGEGTEENQPAVDVKRRVRRTG